MLVAGLPFLVCLKKNISKNPNLNSKEIWFNWIILKNYKRSPILRNHFLLNENEPGNEKEKGNNTRWDRWMDGND